MKPAAFIRLSGLSKTTVYDIRNGVLKNLGLTRANVLLNSIGLQLAVVKIQPNIQEDQTALEGATVFASKNQRKLMPVELLERLCTQPNVHLGEYAPFVHRLLLNGEVALLAAVAEEVSAKTGVGPGKVWDRLRDLAMQLKVKRDVWD